MLAARRRLRRSAPGRSVTGWATPGAGPCAPPPSARSASSSAWRSDSISVTRLSTSSPSPEMARRAPLTESSTALATSSSSRASSRRRRSRASVDTACIRAAVASCAASASRVAAVCEPGGSWSSAGQLRLRLRGRRAWRAHRRCHRPGEPPARPRRRLAPTGCRCRPRWTRSGPSGVASTVRSKRACAAQRALHVAAPRLGQRERVDPGARACRRAGWPPPPGRPRPRRRGRSRRGRRARWRGRRRRRRRRARCRAATSSPAPPGA